MVASVASPPLPSLEWDFDAFIDLSRAKSPKPPALYAKIRLALIVNDIKRYLLAKLRSRRREVTAKRLLTDGRSAEATGEEVEMK